MSLNVTLTLVSASVNQMWMADAVIIVLLATTASQGVQLAVVTSEDLLLTFATSLMELVFARYVYNAGLGSLTIRNVCFSIEAHFVLTISSVTGKAHIADFVVGTCLV